MEPGIGHFDRTKTSYQIAIVTAWHEENFDIEQEPRIKTVESLEETHLQHAALEAAYDIADLKFDEYEDRVYEKDEGRGYTEYNGTIYIDCQTIIRNNPETNQLQIIYCRDGDCIECWTKPEENNHEA